MAGGAQGSEYIRGLGATGDPRVIAGIAAGAERLWPGDMERYCLTYRDLLQGMLNSVSHQSNLQTVEATVNPVLVKKEAEVSEHSRDLVSIQGLAIRLLARTATRAGPLGGVRLQVVDRCLDYLDAWRKEIRPEYNKPCMNFNVMIGGTDAAAQEARIKLADAERIAHRQNLLSERQWAIEREVGADAFWIKCFLRDLEKQNPELLKDDAARMKRASDLAGMGR